MRDPKEKFLSEKIIFCGIDASAGGVSVAVGEVTPFAFDAPRIFGQFNQYPCLNAAEILAEKTAELLQNANLSPEKITDWVCVNGPGGFSGVRTGVAFVNGVVAVTGANIIPVSSGEALIASVAATDLAQSKKIISCLNAKRGEVYFRSSDMKDDQSDELLNFSVVSEKISALLETDDRVVTLVGHGASNVFQDLQDRFSPCEIARISLETATQSAIAADFSVFALHRVRYRATAILAPYYLREPDAVLPVN